MSDRAARLAEGFCPDEAHGALDPRDGWCGQCAARWRLRDDGLIALMPVAEEMREAVPLTFYRKVFSQLQIEASYLQPGRIAEIEASYRGIVANDE